MRLSELNTGEEAYIKGVEGFGTIKERINEMGFIPGQKVKAIKAAPLKDPVEFNIMGYKLTIRQKDARMILIEKESIETKEEYPHLPFKEIQAPKNGATIPTHANASKTINVALVGNPNCGKTTLFNYATQSKERVANYSGVTVAAKEAQIKLKGYTINVIDLPGTYSLKPYSPEELYVIDYLVHNKPDLVINVIDAGNLERNLFLTTQLIDTGLKLIVALNMYDDLELNNEAPDIDKLGNMLGFPFIPTIGTKGIGISELFEKVIEIHEKQETNKEVQIWLGSEINEAVDDLLTILRNNDELPDTYKSRYAAIQLLSNDKFMKSILPTSLKKELEDLCKKKTQEIESLLGIDIKSEIISRRYGFIDGALKETFASVKRKDDKKSHVIDKVLTNKYVGIPAFFVIIWFIFFCTFKLGEYPMNLIDSLMTMFGAFIDKMVNNTVLNSLMVDGIIGGVGGVLGFLPNIIILFLLISILEDSGYMARTAFLMDKVMHKIGLHGKSFIPLLMGFGCNIPAVMATRTIESKRDRIITMFITPFMSCSARLPVYVLFISAFFPKSQSLILFSIYSIGIMAAFLTAIILNNTAFKKESTPFVMELPPYRIPTLKAITKHTWFKTNHFIKKMGTVILAASFIVWALGYFPRDKEIISTYDSHIEELKAQKVQEDEHSRIAIESKVDELESSKQSALLEQSSISRTGRFLEPVFAPLGFDWRMSVSVLTGVMAKEVVVSSMGVLYHSGKGADETSATLVNKLRSEKEKNNTPLVAYFSFLVFVLLYFPCLGTLIAINKETAKFKWTLFAAIYPLIFAWLVSFTIYQTGILF